MKLSSIFESMLNEHDIKLIGIKDLLVLIEREIKVGDNLSNKLKTVNNGLSNHILKFLNSDKIKDVNVDYVDYHSENEQLLTLGFTDREGNNRTRNVKIIKLLKYLGANISDIKGYEIEELVSHFQKGELDNFKIVKGQDILKAYHCENYDQGETMGSCMRFSHAQKYLEIYVNNPNQVACLVLFNPENHKVMGRALIWTLDNGEKFIDRIYVTNEEHKKHFNTYIAKYKLSNNTPNETVTLDNAGEYEYYPYMDTLTHYTPDTGELSTRYGELELQDTGGNDSSGVYSEMHDTRIPEDEAVYIEHMEDWVYEHEIEESWKRDGTYLYRDDMNVKEITKGDYKGWYALNSDNEQEWVEDYENEIIVIEDSWFIDKGKNEGYYASDGEVITDFFDDVIMKDEAITATLGSAKGHPILDTDAFIFTSGPNKGKIFHEQDESEVKDNSKYDYVSNILNSDDYVLEENKKLSLNKLYKEMLNEELTYRHANTDGVEDDEYEIGMVKEEYDLSNLRFNDGKFNKIGPNTIYMDDNPIVDFGVGQLGQVNVGGKTFDNALYLQGGFNASEQRKGYGSLALKFIFTKLPKIQFIILQCLDSAKPFWDKMGGEVVAEKPYGKSTNSLYTMAISRGNFL